jgi:hypothetical protein
VQLCRAAHGKLVTSTKVLVTALMNHRDPSRLLADELPRRLRLSAREIGVAVALTFAAAIQLISALSTRDGKAGAINPIEPAALVRTSG